MEPINGFLCGFLASLTAYRVIIITSNSESVAYSFIKSQFGLRFTVTGKLYDVISLLA
jgi:hypothetical protein